MLATLGTGSDVFKLYDATIAAVPNTSTTTDPPGPLGNMVAIPNNSQGLTIGYVTSAGALIDGSSSGYYAPAATDVKVELVADSGDMVWVLVTNTTGAPFERGEVVAFQAGDPTFDVVKAPAGAHSGSLVGVCQWDIPDGKASYVLCCGVGQILAGAGAITADTSLKVDGVTAGAAEDAAALDPVVAFAYTAAAAGNLAQARISMA
jgi:hypothetical protein